MLNIENDTLDTAAAAKQIGVAASTLNSWRSRKKGPKYIRIAGRIRYLKTDVQEWLENEIAAA
ncbi:helix-turn-helix transcriptional regulator [Corynebacterium tuberculostearicum]|uniref:helix-turn-helix transcriptional regulator n=1 Tax=Corynebacterium tuberculostearicum TaxID=38304 RepID=UPI0038D0AE39